MSKCKKCNGSGEVHKMITYGGGTYGGDKGYWYRVWMVDKCDCLRENILIKFLKAISNIFYKGDNSVTA